MSIRRRLALIICPELRPLLSYDAGALRERMAARRATHPCLMQEHGPGRRNAYCVRCGETVNVALPEVCPAQVKERPSGAPKQTGSLRPQGKGSSAPSSRHEPAPIQGPEHRSDECPDAGSDARACWLCNPEPPGRARSMSEANLGFRYMTGDLG